MLFDQLMIKLGGDVSLDVEAGETILVSLNCQTPDHDAGKEIITEASLTNDPMAMQAFPWVVFYANPENPEQFLKDARKFVENYEANPGTYPSDQEPRDAHFRVMRNLLDVRANFTQSGGAVLDGEHLQFSGVRFSKISAGLPAFIAWLESKGCQGIVYEIEQEKWELPPGMGNSGL
jgi:hypothetical protein